MKQGTSVLAGGSGSIPYSGYKKPQGLRNKRKAHWAQIRRTEQMLKENKERELLRGQQDDFESFDN